MAKCQKRTSREAKKPKSPKKIPAPPAPLLVGPPSPKKKSAT